MHKKIGIYAITDQNLSASKNIFFDIEQMCKGGCKYIQIREKNITEGEFINIATKAKKITQKYGAYLIINDSLNTAILSNADGLHIGQKDIEDHKNFESESERIATQTKNIFAIRKALGPQKILGLSVPNKERLLIAKNNNFPVDYIGCGAVFPTKTHNTPYLLGINGLEELKKISPYPIVAIGGIHKENFLEVAKAKVSGVAMVSEIVRSNDIEWTIKEYFKVWKKNMNKQ